MKTSNIIIAALVLIVASFGVSSYFDGIKDEKEKNINKSLEIQNRELKEKIDTVMLEKSEIEEIKESIDISRSMEIEKKEIVDEVTLSYQAQVWYTRCLEARGQLHLKGIETELSCSPYYYDVLAGGWNTEPLDNLGRFSSENLEATLIELGLK